MGRGNPQGSRELPRFRRADSGLRRALARADQGRCRSCERRARPARRRQGRADRCCRRAGRLGRARRPVPDRRLPDRIRHLFEHERQRGAGGARRRGRSRERRRQHGPVLERRLSERRPPGRARRADERPDPGAGGARRGARGEGRRVRRRRQVGAHPPDGRRAGDPRAGVRRLRRPGPPGGRARPRHASARRPDPARRHGGRHRPEHASRVRRARAHAALAGDGARDPASGRSLRVTGRARRPRRGFRRAQGRRRLADQDRQ